MRELTRFKKAGIVLITAVGISLSYLPNAKSQYVEMLGQISKEAGEECVKAIVGFNRIMVNAITKSLDGLEKISSEYLPPKIKEEADRMLIEGYSPELFYVDDKCYLPAEGIENLLKDNPRKAYETLEALEREEEANREKRYELSRAQFELLKKIYPEQTKEVVDNFSGVEKSILLYNPFARLDGGRHLTKKDISVIKPAVDLSGDEYLKTFRAGRVLKEVERAKKALREARRSIEKVKK